MPDSKTLQLPDTISVRALASELGVDPTAVIGKLIAGGVMASINQTIDYDTAALVAEEFGFSALEAEKKEARITKNVTTKNAAARAPIVTIMGHVDHGKTSLLDYIRSSNVALDESGGITQHISAYQISFVSSDNEQKKITFIDTPGHEAFSALRAHGASLTDLVVVVVAADDGVKPQTLEVLEHASSNNVPIIIAINKIDTPGANPERVKQQLAEQSVMSEEWGGKTVFVPLSAKTGEGVDKLLEMIVLTTDLLELKADPYGQPEGVVIEANLDKQVGPLATILIYNGTLRPGQVVVVGKTYGRVRTLADDRGEKLAQAGPARPVVLVGLKAVPNFGDRLMVVPNEKVARSMTQDQARGQTSQTNEDQKRVAIILKADVGGSLAALEDSLRKLKSNDATADIISSGIGQVTENDLTLAKAASAQVISFRLPVPKRLQELADKDGIVVKENWIIYEVIDYITAELKRIASPVIITEQVGRLKVLAIFKQKGTEAIVGGDVVEGRATNQATAIIMRDKEEIGRAKVTGLKIGKVDASEVEKGQQCGVNLAEAPAVAVGDLLIFETSRAVTA